jgi:alkylation response protein AidB-like acyl-CoA dehydrogenase
MFITHGTSADTLVVMAVTDKTKSAKGISAFILERGMGGLMAGKKEDKLGMRASETTEVILQNCRVSAAQLLGEEGQGFIQTLQVLDAGRIGIAALSVGLAQGAYEAARRYTAQRKQFGRAIASFLRSGRLSGTSPRRGATADLQAAWLKDQGRRMTLDSRS